MTDTDESKASELDVQSDAEAEDAGAELNPFGPPGPVDPHGHPVYSKKEPDPKQAQFNPDFLCVVYLKFEANQVLTARYGHVQAADLLNPDTVRTLATLALEALSRNDASGFHEGKIYRDLEFISVGRQLIMILFLDNDPRFVKFEDINDFDYVVRFSQLSAFQPGNPTRPIEKNNAFCNLMKFSVTGLTGQDAFRLDYWDTDRGGRVSDPLPSQTHLHRRYSMNIYFRMAIANFSGQPSGRWIPLVIDPDTGNMGGGP